MSLFFFICIVPMFWLSHVCSLCLQHSGSFAASVLLHFLKAFTYADITACFTGNIIHTVINFAVVSEQWTHFERFILLKANLLYIWWFVKKCDLLSVTQLSFWRIQAGLLPHLIAFCTLQCALRRMFLNINQPSFPEPLGHWKPCPMGLSQADSWASQR